MWTQNWMVVAFIAPMLWALVNLIDLFLAKEVFADEEEAVAISGILGALPCVVILAGEALPKVDVMMAGLAVVGGLLFAIYTFYYFRCLFISGDATLIMIMVNITGLTVPLVAALLIQERLTAIKYVAIAIVVIGSMAVGFGSKVVYEKLRSILRPSIFSIVTLTLSLVAEGKVYQEIGFKSGLLCFSLGLYLGGLFFFLKRIAQGKEIFNPSIAIAPALLGIEGLNLLAVTCSQYAIKVSPAVSYVVAIETTIPAFIILFSLIAYGVCALFGSTKYLPMLKDQLTGYRGKVVAIAVVTYGVYLIGG